MKKAMSSTAIADAASAILPLGLRFARRDLAFATALFASS
jgi:hypothetical protein